MNFTAVAVAAVAAVPIIRAVVSSPLTKVALGATPWKWSDLMYGFWPEPGGLEDGEEAFQTRGDCREAAAG